MCPAIPTSGTYARGSISLTGYKGDSQVHPPLPPPNTADGSTADAAGPACDMCNTHASQGGGNAEGSVLPWHASQTDDELLLPGPPTSIPRITPHAGSAQQQQLAQQGQQQKQQQEGQQQQVQQGLEWRSGGQEGCKDGEGLRLSSPASGDLARLEKAGNYCNRDMAPARDREEALHAPQEPPRIAVLPETQQSLGRLSHMPLCVCVCMCVCVCVWLWVLQYKRCLMLHNFQLPFGFCLAACSSPALRH